MSRAEIIYLGPKGTYASVVAQRRYARNGAVLKNYDTILDVCEYVAAKPSRKGVVPIVNSSGGLIDETIDALLDDKLSLSIQEELTMNVTLALLGHKGEKVKRVYSHHAPMMHCQDWLRKKYPKAERITVASTALAAERASEDRHSAAISRRGVSSTYKVDILQCPVPPGKSRPNVTHFFIIGKKCQRLPRINKTSLAVYLQNNPGALCDFLEPFREAGLNLSRIFSRPIPGEVSKFAFYIDVDNSIHSAKLQNVLRKARRHTTKMRVLGSYPSHRTYTS